MSQAIAMRRSGMSKKQVAMALHVSRDTVRSYEEGRLPQAVDRAAVEGGADHAAEIMANKLDALIPKMMDAADKRIPETGFKDLLIGIGIGIQRRELLRGRPTSREGRQVVITFSADPSASSLRELGERALSGTQSLPEPALDGEFVPKQD